MKHVLICGALCGVFLASGALAQSVGPSTDRVCVPKVLLEKWIALTVSRPWAEVASVMDDLRVELHAPQACDKVEPPPKAP